MVTVILKPNNMNHPSPATNPNTWQAPQGMPGEGTQVPPHAPQSVDSTDHAVFFHTRERTHPQDALVDFVMDQGGLNDRQARTLLEEWSADWKKAADARTLDNRPDRRRELIKPIKLPRSLIEIYRVKAEKEAEELALKKEAAREAREQRREAIRRRREHDDDGHDDGRVPRRQTRDRADDDRTTHVDHEDDPEAKWLKLAKRIDYAKSVGLLHDEDLSELATKVGESDSALAAERRQELKDNGEADRLVIKPAITDSKGNIIRDAIEQLPDDEWADVSRKSRDAVAREHLDRLVREGKISSYDKDDVRTVAVALSAVFSLSKRAGASQQSPVEATATADADAVIGTTATLDPEAGAADVSSEPPKTDHEVEPEYAHLFREENVANLEAAISAAALQAIRAEANALGIELIDLDEATKTAAIRTALKKTLAGIAAPPDVLDKLHVAIADHNHKRLAEIDQVNGRSKSDAAATSVSESVAQVEGQPETEAGSSPEPIEAEPVDDDRQPAVRVSSTARTATEAAQPTVDLSDPKWDEFLGSDHIEALGNGILIDTEAKVAKEAKGQPVDELRRSEIEFAVRKEMLEDFFNTASTPAPLAVRQEVGRRLVEFLNSQE